MSAVEEIEAAIATLTGLRDEATAGLWAGRYYEGASLPKQRIVSVTASAEDDEYGFERVVALGDYFTKTNAELIVTLHRTIDAQLAILRLSLEYGELVGGNGSRFTDTSLTLARAINGTTA